MFRAKFKKGLNDKRKKIKEIKDNPESCIVINMQQNYIVLEGVK